MEDLWDTKLLRWTQYEYISPMTIDCFLNVYKFFYFGKKYVFKDPYILEQPRVHCFINKQTRLYCMIIIFSGLFHISLSNKKIRFVSQSKIFFLQALQVHDRESVFKNKISSFSKFYIFIIFIDSLIKNLIPITFW